MGPCFRRGDTGDGAGSMLTHHHEVIPRKRESSLRNITGRLHPTGSSTNTVRPSPSHWPASAIAAATRTYSSALPPAHTPLIHPARTGPVDDRAGWTGRRGTRPPAGFGCNARLKECLAPSRFRNPAAREACVPHIKYLGAHAPRGPRLPPPK